MSEEQANGSGKADIKEVETVLGEPNRFPDTVGNGLYDPVSRVGDDTYVQRHGGTNPGKDDSGGKDLRCGLPDPGVLPEQWHRLLPRNICGFGRYVKQSQLQQMRNIKGR